MIPDPSGGNLYKHRESGSLVHAIKMAADFTLTTKGGRDVHGETGDYIVRAIDGEHTWLIRSALFEAAYEEVNPPPKYSRRSD